MHIGDLVEVTGPNDSHFGKEGIVMAIEGDQATVAPVDTNEWKLNGDEFEINAGLLVNLPTPADLEREREAHIAKDIANAKAPNTLPLPKIRTYRQFRSRNKRADY